MFKDDFPVLTEFMDVLVYVTGVMRGVGGQVMMNSREVTGDVGSRW